MLNNTIVLDHSPEPQNYYANLIRNQRFALISSLQLESGRVLQSCPIAYQTWGCLNATGDNAIVVCHALTGSSDVSDWWTPLLGSGKAFDPRHFFIFCANVLGSPYGSASPLSTNPETGKRYGPSFPLTTVRDDVRAHKLVLDALGVASIACVIGGSMGGMLALEWPLCTLRGYVQSIIPIATAADHSAWGISWAETQRQCIYCDPVFAHGAYDPIPVGQPTAGLTAARMVAMLTYRSGVSFETRFGRRRQLEKSAKVNQQEDSPLDLPRTALLDDTDRETAAYNDSCLMANLDFFSVQSYLHYQGAKFVRRFDANCYLHLTQKMDGHDVTSGREASCLHGQSHNDEQLSAILADVPACALVISIDSDALFLPEQQSRLAKCLPRAELAILRSIDGHDGFLLEFDQLNYIVRRKLRDMFPQFYEVVLWDGLDIEGEHEETGPGLTAEVELE